MGSYKKLTEKDADVFLKLYQKYLNHQIKKGP